MINRLFASVASQSREIREYFEDVVESVKGGAKALVTTAEEAKRTFDANQAKNPLNDPTFRKDMYERGGY